ncbi:MAG: hypothetical protein ACI9A7_000741 [Cyclobacteriaceae bacterium]|jgi:hypothetical protein
MFFKNVLSLSFCFFFIFSVCGQTETIPEEDVSLDVQKWFYSQYPKSSEAIWGKEHTASSKERYKVAFVFENTKMSAIYDNEGDRISEQKEIVTPHITLVNYVQDNYEKPKIKEVILKTDFVSNEITYIMDVKSKDNGNEILLFDEDFNRVIQEFVSSN